MEHLNKRKLNLLFFWFLLPFVILYGGYAIGKLEETKVTINNLQEILLYSLAHPWPPRFTLLTVLSDYYQYSNIPWI